MYRPLHTCVGPVGTSPDKIEKHNSFYPVRPSISSKTYMKNKRIFYCLMRTEQASLEQNVTFVKFPQLTYLIFFSLLS